MKHAITPHIMKKLFQEMLKRKNKTGNVVVELKIKNFDGLAESRQEPGGIPVFILHSSK